MWKSLALGALAGLILSCHSDAPVNPSAPRPVPRAVAAGGVVPTPVPLVTPTPLPTATATPTVAAPTATPTTATIPTPTPTASPTPRPVATSQPLSDPTCLDLSTVPSTAVPVFTGQGCRTNEGFVPVRDPGTNTEGCVRNWRCADGDDRYQPAARIGASLNTGGPNGVHRCNPGEGAGPEFICDTGRAGQEAYGRNIHDDGRIIQPPPESDGRIPGAWERAGICRPVVCGATPRPTLY